LTLCIQKIRPLTLCIPKIRPLTLCIHFSDFRYKEIRTITQDNTGKKIKFGMPKYCTTGILEDSEELQAIIKEDWGKLEQLNPT
jgi:hypothetical protein